MCTLAALTVVNGGFIDAPGHAAYTGDVHSHHHEYAPVAKYAYSAPSVNHVYSTVKEISHTPVHHHYTTAPIQESVEYAPVQKTVEYTPVVHKTVQYDHHSTPSHTLAYPIKKAVGYAPIAKTISYAPAVYEQVHHHEPTYQHTHESVERNNAGTVSHYGKTVSSPHSHVQKYDTRVTNEQYKVAVAPALHYKVAPAVHHQQVPQVHHYTHSTPVGLEYSQQAPAQQHYSTPVQHHYTQSAPVQHHYAQSAPVQHHYSHSAPVQHHSHSHSAPVQHYTQSVPTQEYAHAAPVVKYNKAVNYSPAEAVSHTSFHSNDAQYSW